MYKHRCSSLILSSVLVIAAVFTPRGRTTAPPDRARSSEMTEVVDMEIYLYSRLRDDGEIKSPLLPFEIYVQKIQGRKLIAPVLKHRNAHGDIDYVMQAREAELMGLRERKALYIRLYQGKATGADGSHCLFERKDMALNLPIDFGSK